MTDSGRTISVPDTGSGYQQRLQESGKTWFQTRGGRRYGREIAAIVILKLVLLMLLWFVFIKPWPRPATPRAADLRQIYTPAAAVRHD
jgi:hypothetical protein